MKQPRRPAGGRQSDRTDRGQRRPAASVTSPRPAAARSDRQREPAGYDVRALAVRLISAVLDRGRPLDEALAQAFDTSPGRNLDPRDKGLARLIAATVLRRKGELEAVVATFIDRPLPADKGLVMPILLAATAQLLVLGIAPHAVINIAVEQCRHDRGARRFDRLANAVLRRVSEGGATLLATAGGARCNVPAWMWQRWRDAYGEATADRLATACLQEAALDLSVRSDALGWAERLGGSLLPTGSVRLDADHPRVAALEGFGDGAWWVQDAAAALPVRLFGDVAGLRVADLCAAPGGKTAQLAAAGALVTAVDQSDERLQRVRDNLQRLRLNADVVCADVLSWTPQAPFDAVLLDAPCTATGTIRRHPDILHLKRKGDVTQLAALQRNLLDKAAALVRPGGLLVYCTCSLEPEEGEAQIVRLLAHHADLEAVPIQAHEIGGMAECIDHTGALRTMPFHSPGGEAISSGMDGFYACRLRRRT